MRSALRQASTASTIGCAPTNGSNRHERVSAHVDPAPGQQLADRGRVAQVGARSRRGACRRTSSSRRVRMRGRLGLVGRARPDERADDLLGPRPVERQPVGRELGARAVRPPIPSARWRSGHRPTVSARVASPAGRPPSAPAAAHARGGPGGPSRRPSTRAVGSHRDGRAARASPSSSPRHRPPPSRSSWPRAGIAASGRSCSAAQTRPDQLAQPPNNSRCTAARSQQVARRRGSSAAGVSLDHHTQRGRSGPRPRPGPTGPRRAGQVRPRRPTGGHREDQRERRAPGRAICRAVPARSTRSASTHHDAVRQIVRPALELGDIGASVGRGRLADESRWRGRRRRARPSPVRAGTGSWRAAARARPPGAGSSSTSIDASRLR